MCWFQCLGHIELATNTKKKNAQMEDPEGWDGEGGGIGMGNTCKSMADSCQCMAKTTTIF